MKHIEVEYNRELQPLEAILSGVRRPGEFFVAGTLEIPMPRVEVEGAGALSFPIPVPQIQAMLQHAVRAPYGRGADTIVDTSVRKVWQIAPDAVKVSGKSWAASFDSILAKVIDGLGCHGKSVSAELYKMLVYDRGGFFLPHRDTEKTTGMFGTLVVTLPTFHRGGALRIRHADRQVTLETHATDPSEVSFAAFYSDCEHEVLPVQAGHRVCLLYNLIHEGSKGKRQLLKAPNYEPQVADAAMILEAYWKSPAAPFKIAWLLEHHYSPAGLAFASLKGADAARAQALVQAAGRANCVAHLGVVHIVETGAAELEGGYFHDQWDDEQEDEDEPEDFESVCVDDTWQFLDEWRDTEDRAVEFGPIPLSAGELLPAGALDNESPDERRLTEATGNEGASYELSYHRAALVIWPAKRTIDVLLQAGAVAALPYLKQLVAEGQTAHAKAVAAARRIVRAWPTPAQPQPYIPAAREPQSADRITVISALAQLKAPALLEQFIVEAVFPTFDGSENTVLLTAAAALGARKATEVLAALIKMRIRDRPDECAELLLALGASDPPPSFRKVAKAALEGLDTIGTRGVNPFERGDQGRYWPRTDGVKAGHLKPQFVTNLFGALSLFGGRTLHDEAAAKLASRLEVFHPVTLLVPAIEQLCSDQDPMPPAVARVIQQLWTSAAEYLLLRSEVPPPPPTDWRFEVNLPCTCMDCRELRAFARDPSESLHRFRVNKDRRRHLHQMIDRHRLDMTHVTVRTGSPQTLVCTKDRRTFKARMQEYHDELAAMRKLLKLARHSAVDADLSIRMEAAVKAGRI
ncbi:2OG-Fe(II) oxygenase [Paludibaculum fermentans]|uniref:2OG-Fe(II) oxygenase n=1 Tax=Paludibaculum fermentans TaxID=1473598 RepID=A0A7S7SMK4_PALFE|nr:2OG-Fe(II) oxygenase [Paludibaculum fermentans]QOY89571.1 2OG-Fe(II) oxygenase [Paludibaculum fermentans]